jgi:hypothetical protein
MKSFMRSDPPGRRRTGSAPTTASTSSSPRASSVARDAGQLGGEVRQQDVRRSTEDRGERRDRLRGADVRRQRPDVRVLQRLDVRHVDADDVAAWADPLRRDLEPAARPRSEVDDDVTRAEDPKARVELGELVRATRAVAGGPSPAVVRVLPPIAHRAPARERSSVVLGLVRLVSAERALVRNVAGHGFDLRRRDEKWSGRMKSHSMPQPIG